MKREILIVLAMVLLLNFISCGGGSTEAKELFKKILQLVGIPQSIVVNICQDANRDGICNLNDPIVKVSIQEKDSFRRVLEKLEAIEDGRYLLETEDPTLPILVEIKDNRENASFMDQFILPFNGFNVDEGNKSKELSILQAMVDSGSLSSNDIEEIKQLEDQSSLDRFYESLLQNLEINLKHITENNISIQRAVSITIQEMGERLKEKGIADTLPLQINDCNGNQICLDSVLEDLTEVLQLDKNQTQQIKESETFNIKQLLAGKTLYTSIYDQVKTLESWSFNESATSAEWRELLGGECSGSGTTILNGSYIYFTSTFDSCDDQEIGQKIEISVLDIQEKYLLISVDHNTPQRLFFSEEDAKAYLFDLDDGSDAPTFKLVPFKTISSLSDWSDVKAIYIDNVNDTELSSLDIKEVKIAQDNDYLYINLERNGLEFPPEDYYYNYWIFFRASNKTFSIENFHDNQGLYSFIVYRDIGYEGGETVLYQDKIANTTNTNLNLKVPKSLDIIDEEQLYTVSIFTHAFKEGEKDIKGENEENTEFLIRF